MRNVLHDGLHPIQVVVNDKLLHDEGAVLLYICASHFHIHSSMSGISSVSISQSLMCSGSK